ncbi:MAG: hypothetical protein P9X26_03045 [Candidatus Stygibacter frigidus]|nr:hypothetical protein [Candidatus Stygibacter frigidus]
MCKNNNETKTEDKISLKQELVYNGVALLFGKMHFDVICLEEQ